ncbi:hypothetical protein HPG69_005672 [Diceros bicornis minor]|uniref:G-protein coupled receptors family 1 profile domain-containing protein n=1 Tax=Diceros bicornis minor TaxID=77932 RepID=A0A7J7ESJ3_DICBM|nr:hypothetical protein HPG69_005672 [Diceros bicornis minor]
MKLLCSDTKINSAFGLTAISSTVGVDSIFILLSYILIIRSILNIASPERRKKAFSTCISHITANGVFISHSRTFFQQNYSSIVIMSSFPNITSSSLMFFLMGIPGLEASHAWISIPFCCLYITAPSGGGIILFVIIIESNLHKSPLFPLYALHTDLGLCISTLVTMLGIFWFTARQIIFHACLSRSDNKINSVLGLTALIVTAEVASIFIPLSNTLIIKTILSIASPQEQHKAFSICVSHIGAVVIFYIPLISLCFVYRFGQKVPPYVHSLMANVYLLILPVMNPIIYHGKTKQIHRSIKKNTMDILRNMTSKFPTFLLTGIPGLESAHDWISIPFCCLYAIALSGNSMILFVIITQQTLREPMYYFLSMLSAADLGLTVSTMSTTLGILWFDASEISLDTCIVQMFFLHGFTFIESGVLVAMAFDRYVAICDPLRYTTILTNSRITQMGLLMIIRAVVLIVPLLLLLKPLDFCRVNILSHSYCYHPDVIKLACSDTQVNNIWGLINLILTTGVDTPCIFLSYILIIFSVLNIVSPEE